MRIHTGVVLAVLLFAPGARAQDKGKNPDSFLSADALFYLHFDGIDAHRAAYEKTILAKVMKEDFGDFLSYAGPHLVDLFGEGGLFFFPGGKARWDKVRTEFARAASFVTKNGVVLAIEVPEKAGVIIKGRRDLFHIEGVQATFVFPRGGLGKNQDQLVPFFRALAGIGEVEVAEKKVRGRTMQTVDLGDYRAAWWPEGSHLVLTVGWLPVERTLDVIDGKRPNVAGLPTHKTMAGFKDFNSYLRGHADLVKIVDLLKTPPESDRPLERLKQAIKRGIALNQLGLTGLKSLTFHCGFEGQYQRRSVVMQVAEPGDRPGLLRLVSGPAAFDPKKLPPLPHDAASVRVLHIDWVQAGDVLFNLLKLKDLEAAFGGFPLRGHILRQVAGLDFDFRKEILPHLDSTLVAYNALSEGPWLLGQVVAIKVKDKTKLLAGLDNLNRALARLLGEPEGKPYKKPEGKPDPPDKNKFEVSLLQQVPREGFRKRVYRGTDIYVWEGRSGRFFPQFIPLSYTVHKGWLVISPFPQAVKGYIMRGTGKYKVWQAPPITAQALDLAKKKAGPQSRLVSVHVSDPSPSLEVALAILPPLVHFTQMFNRRGENEEIFDISRIPHPQSVTEWLSPNVTLLYDDGPALRWESHSSLNLPLEELFYLSLLGLIL